MGNKSNNGITVEVYAPRDPSPRKFTWPKETLVGDAADEAAKSFGYEGGKPTFQNKEKHDLPRDKTLADAGVQEFDTLKLTDTGGGV